MGDWGWALGPHPHSPIPNPQSPIPNPQCVLKLFFNLKFNINLNYIHIFKFSENE